MNRQHALTQWLTLKLGPIRLTKITDDASFRRYFRVFCNHQTYIAMDSPPDKERNQAFIEIGTWLYRHHINTPHIIDCEYQQGFLLLEDFGDQTLLKALNKNNILIYYQQAIDCLKTIQQLTPNKTLLPHYTQSLLMQEMQLLLDWYLPYYAKRTLSHAAQQAIHTVFTELCDYLSKLKQCVVHRDYHTRNLMIINTAQLGVLDFQDALIGAYSYDVVSLLKDVYIQLTPQQYRTLLDYYQQNVQPQLSYETLNEHVDFCGVQRHLKILGIFTRLSKRDGKHQYLEDIPLTQHYLAEMINKYPRFQCLECVL